MKSPKFGFKFLVLRLLFLTLFLAQCCFGLNSDSVALLSFKYSVKDPLAVFQTWNYWDQTPCLWTGVSCSPAGSLDTYSRVTDLSLPNSQLSGSLISDLSAIQHLRKLDLSNNSFNGSIPLSLFNVSQLRFLDLSKNMLSGEIPESILKLSNLQVLNLSENAFAGKIPFTLTALQNLTVASLNNNYFSGVLPSGFDFVRVLDLSSNLINGSLPADFGGFNVEYFNVSFNKLSGEISPYFARKIPENATVDLSYNNLMGEVPESTLFSNQESKSFAGNQDLCGRVLNNPCTIPSSLSDPPPDSNSPTESPPAIAAIPKQGLDSQKSSGKLRPVTIVAIVIGDLVGIIIFVVVFIYVCQLRRRNKNSNVGTKKTATIEASVAKDDWSTSSSETKGITSWSCLRKKTVNDNDQESSSDSSDDTETEVNKKGQPNQGVKDDQANKGGSLVTVDGEKELELETLLKASAYILGATGSSIMYKAVLEDGTVLAVRRIGESGLNRIRDFENQVRVLAKLVHRNLVRIRGFYWGVDEKLVIYDFVPNGSLANARYRKTGSSPSHLPWEMRLKIAKGIAKGLTYLHDKKLVHGNLKPSNILLGLDMEPKIGDFGLERLVSKGESSYTTGGSSRNFGSKRSTASRESFQELPNAPSPNPSPSPSSLSCASYYHAPESLRTLKPNAKWDVYAFGVLLLELLTGKVMDIDELTHGPGPGLVIEDKTRALKMSDVAIRPELEGKEDAFVACFKLGMSCVSLVPQKRPLMKEVVQVLEKIPPSPPSQFYVH